MKYVSNIRVLTALYYRQTLAKFSGRNKLSILKLSASFSCLEPQNLSHVKFKACLPSLARLPCLADERPKSHIFCVHITYKQSRGELIYFEKPLTDSAALHKHAQPTFQNFQRFQEHLIYYIV